MPKSQLIKSLYFDSHLVNSPLFCQPSYQLTNSITVLYDDFSYSPILDNFPQSKNPWLSFRFKTRPQTTESLYLLILLHSYLSTLDINTTVSTCASSAEVSKRSLVIFPRVLIISSFREMTALTACTNRSCSASWYKCGVLHLWRRSAYFSLHCHTTLRYLLLECHIFGPNNPPQAPHRMRPENTWEPFRVSTCWARYSISFCTRCRVSD